MKNEGHLYIILDGHVLNTLFNFFFLQWVKRWFPK